MEEEHKQPVVHKDKKQGGSSALRALGAGVVVALIIGVGVFYGVTRSRVADMSTSPVVLKAAQVFGIPIAKVNGHKILYTEYVANLDSMNTFYETQDPTQKPSDEEMSQYILSRLIINQLLEQAAKAQDVHVTPEEVNTQVDQEVLSSFASREEAETEISNMYGWSFDEFVDRIIYPRVLEQKLADSFVTDSGDSNEQIRMLAEEVLQQIQNGASFEDMAAQYGSDGTKDVGGDLGWFGRGAMVPQFEDAVFALEPGELDPELVETEFGYHIVQLDDKRTTTADDGTEQEEVKARHILFPYAQPDYTDFTSFMDNLLREAKIETLYGLDNPFAEYVKSEDTLSEDVSTATEPTEGDLVQPTTTDEVTE